MLYRIHFTAPLVSEPVWVEGRDAADAVGEFMETRLDRCLFVRPDNLEGDGRETAYFAVVEVEGTGTLVARHFYSGIGRAGGMRAANPREMKSLREAELALGLSPGTLSPSGWEGEESSQEAQDRKFNKGSTRT